MGTSRTVQEVLEAHQTPHQLRIEEFMRKAGQDLPEVPVVPSEAVRKLRAKLILEEAFETISAGLGLDIWIGGCAWSHGIKEVELGSNPRRPPNLIEIADGCADISVVTIGTLSACGIKDRPLLEEVDRSNLAKFEIPKCPTHGVMAHEGKGRYRCRAFEESIRCPQESLGPYRADDGKWIKGPAWTPPDVEGVLKAQEPVVDMSKLDERFLRASDDGVHALPESEGSGNGLGTDALGVIVPFPKSPTGLAKIVAYDPDTRASVHSKAWNYLLRSYNPSRQDSEGEPYYCGRELEPLILKTIGKEVEKCQS